MPKKTTVLQIFVGSPTDVNDERELLDKVVAELNRSWSNGLGVTLELLKWETHVHPSSSTYPQAVINEQIGQEYDAFIGIFWRKIGTPTPTAISGSVEEFELAYSRRRANNNKSPEIMMYFKDIPVAIDKKDKKQFAAVKEFKGSMSEKGVVYSPFNDSSSFESSVRSHLSAVAQNFAALWGTYIPASSKLELEQYDSKLKRYGEEYEYVDYFAIHNLRSGLMMESYDLISSSTLLFASQIMQKTKEILNISKNNISINQIENEFADHMIFYAASLNTQISKSTKSRRIGFNALSKALSLIVNTLENNEKLLLLKSTMISLLGETLKALTNLIEMQTTIKDLPHKKNLIFSNAKIELDLQLELLVSEMHSSYFNLKNIITSIDKMLHI
jgi:hypothetical protein